MRIQLQWLGHGGWLVQADGHRVLVDPFLSQNPKAPVAVQDLQADFILVSHGHFDHIADVPELAKHTRATVLANFEIAEWLKAKHRVQNATGMNLGGSVDLGFGRVQMTLALHSSQLPDGGYGGNPSGFLLTLDSRRLYFACDTALFSDMKLFAEPALEVAILPIGDLFTMGPDDSLQAIRFLQPKFALPSHYNTWPPIEQDVEAWSARVRSQTKAQPVVLQPGGWFDPESFV